jgi:hypothetical protein
MGVALGRGLLRRGRRIEEHAVWNQHALLLCKWHTAGTIAQIQKVWVRQENRLFACCVGLTSRDMIYLHGNGTSIGAWMARRVAEWRRRPPLDLESAQGTIDEMDRQ